MSPTRVSFPKRQSKLIPEESKRQWYSAFFILPSLVNHLSLHISPFLGRPSGSLPTLIWEPPFVSRASSHPSLFSIYWNEHHRFYPSVEGWVISLGEKVANNYSSAEGVLTILFMDLWGTELCALCPALKHNDSVSCWIPLPGQLGSMPVLWVIMAKRVFFIF